jgi:hypothetical protein
LRRTILGLAAVAAAIAPAAAQAAPAKPGVATGAATSVTQSSATLTGKVNPKGTATTYYFQVGTTNRYGAQTGPSAAGNGTAAVNASAGLTGLAPATRYHYRLVATNAGGTTLGADKTFTTAKQPLGFAVTATPNPVPFGGPTTIAGQLTGTGSAGRGIQLQQKAFPYTAGFANVGNAQVTNAQGMFAFPVLALTSNTQFRVVTTGSGSVASSVVLVGSAVTVKFAVSSHRIHSGRLVRFAGTVAPREDGALYAVQKQSGGGWVTVGGSSLRSYTPEKSRFAKRIRIRHSGTYRIYVGVADGSHVSNASGSQTIRVVPR